MLPVKTEIDGGHLITRDHIPSRRISIRGPETDRTGVSLDLITAIDDRSNCIQHYSLPSTSRRRKRRCYASLRLSSPEHTRIKDSTHGSHPLTTLEQGLDHREPDNHPRHLDWHAKASAHGLNTCRCSMFHGRCVAPRRCGDWSHARQHATRVRVYNDHRREILISG